ncbi:Ku protein [Saccharopolyspora shandongensis]|uniref:non-homologous end joining protein Ku n=1 Tax=Saccharopolyspora shandongensis TaxID=418495 RepID=UPI003431742A
MAAVWGGVLSFFGLVAIPVQLFSATEDHTIRFHQIQRGTADRVRHKRINERTGDEVPYAEIVKGFPTEHGWVVVEPTELEEIAPGRSRSLEIIGFVDFDDIDPIYVRDTYYLAPSAAEYGKVFALLRNALHQAHRAGIATLVLRNKQRLAALMPGEAVLHLCLLHWADEIRDPHQQLGGTLPEQTTSSQLELDTAVQLIEAMTINWAPHDYRDTYQQKVRELVEAKLSDTAIEKALPPPRSTAVADLMDALQASVEEARAARTPRK